MLTEYEAQKLRVEMAGKLESGLPAVAACAVGLLIIVGVALFGSFDPIGTTDKVALRGHERPSIVEARRLWEERRARFYTQQSQAAGYSDEARAETEAPTLLRRVRE